MIMNAAHTIRAFSYIDWNWPAHSSATHNWYNWGDARIEMNDVVQANWRRNLAGAKHRGALKFLHAQPRNETLAVLGCTETMEEAEV